MTESQSLGGTPAASLHRLLNGAAAGLLIVAGFGAVQGRMPGATVFLLAALGAGTLARRAQQGGRLSSQIERGANSMRRLRQNSPES